MTGRLNEQRRALLPDQPEPVEERGEADFNEAKRLLAEGDIEGLAAFASRNVKARAREARSALANAAATDAAIQQAHEASKKLLPPDDVARLARQAADVARRGVVDPPVPSQPLAEQPQRCPSCESNRPEADLYWDIGTADWETCTDPFHSQEPPTNA